MKIVSMDSNWRDDDRRAYLCQEIVTPRSKRLVTIALQRAGCERDDDDRALEHVSIPELVVVAELGALEPVVRGLACAAAEDADAIDALQPADLLGGLETVHDGELDIHQHQVEAACAPLCHSFLAVHRSLPAHLETLHERTQHTQVDDVVFDDEHVDGWDGPVEQSGW